MNKKQLIARVRQYMGSGTTRNTASAAVEAVLASVLEAASQEKVHIAHFGTFETVCRPARKGFDINTASITTYAAQSRLTFRPSSGFTDFSR
ncbi:MAG: HU family DNA-binding protein [Akkermansia sp.]|nr:HU family DNA-binding protein [Akkermansia sp.]